MKKALWGVMVLGVIAGMTLSGVGEAAPLSGEAKSDKQVKDLPENKWRTLGALDRVKDKNIVQVQTLDGPGDDLQDHLGFVGLINGQQCGSVATGAQALGHSVASGNHPPQKLAVIRRYVGFMPVPRIDHHACRPQSE